MPQATFFVRGADAKLSGNTPEEFWANMRRYADRYIKYAIYREPCSVCGRMLGAFLLWFKDGKPLCDNCERKSGRVAPKSEVACDSDYEHVQGIA